MRLDELRNNVIHEDAPYGALLGREEKLGFLSMMLAKQGLDPYPIINKVRRHIDPVFAQKEEESEKTERQQATLSDWLRNAKRGDIRKGVSNGRKIEIVVTESIYGKIRALLTSRSESKILNKAFDAYPELSYIIRVARQSREPVHSDDVFWGVVDRVTDGRSDEIRKLVNAYHDIDDEPGEMGSQPNEMDEGTISEAKVSAVMLSLGLDRDTVGGLMKQYGIRDEDHRISELKKQMGRFKKFAGEKMGEFPAKVRELPGKIGSVAKELPGKMKELPGKAKSLAKELPGKAKSFGKMMVSRDVAADNEDYAEDVVKIAFMLMNLAQKGSISPEDLTKDVG